MTPEHYEITKIDTHDGRTFYVHYKGRLVKTCRTAKTARSFAEKDAARRAGK